MIKHTRKQTGGTLLGLIVGLIIGLAIAVGVALTIKNTPLPFTNKMGKQDKLSDPGQPRDPNKPLYGNKEPAKEAAKNFAKKAEDVKAAEDLEAAKTQEKEDAKKADAKKPDLKKPEPKQTAKTDVKPDTKTDAKPPVVDKSTPEKSAADKTQKADAGDEKWTYYLQAGAFLEQTDAENTKARLALLGFSANIAEKQADNGTLYRVRVGPFGQLETMNRIRGKLTDNGVDVAVVRVPK